MPRNTVFATSHEPLQSHSLLNIQHKHTTGPFSFLNPTRAHYIHKSLSNKPPVTADDAFEAPVSLAQDQEKSSISKDNEQLASDIEFQWRSRDNRKGRHTLVVDPALGSSSAHYLTPKSTSTLRATAQGIGRMFTRYPYWDVSYLVAVIFTLGSIVWCLNGFFVFLPLVQPNSEFDTEILYGGGITAFIGATIFEVGSVLLMFEAVNENRAGCFGWALEKVLDGGTGRIRVRPDVDGCRHHHSNRKNFVGKGNIGSSASKDDSLDGDLEEHGHLEKSSDGSGKSWQWWPSTHDLTTHYLRELGFLACLAQLFGASVFWISGFTALPGINNVLSQSLLDGIYWAPQIIGGTGFITSG